MLTRRILRSIIDHTETVNFGSAATLTNQSVTVAIKGARLGDLVLVDTVPLNGAAYMGPIIGRVTAANVVTLVWFNTTSGTFDPGAVSVRFHVFLFK
jgi:hypothetical protein